MPNWFMTLDSDIPTFKEYIEPVVVNSGLTTSESEEPHEEKTNINAMYKIFFIVVNLFVS
tara:strand:- start:908 stop:1087 length:180 start_codon:yes stop_codon:yes gene_type:complete